MRAEVSFVWQGQPLDTIGQEGNGKDTRLPAGRQAARACRMRPQEGLLYWGGGGTCQPAAQPACLPP
jgi:hypothetical protein